MKVCAEYRFDTWHYHSFDCMSIRINDNEQLNSIDKRVFEYSRHFRFAPEFSIQRDDIVIAFYTVWNKWFRAQVLSHDNNAVDSVEVCAIDYGHVFDLPKQCIFPLFDTQLAHIEPVQPIRIGIYGIKRRDRWTTEKVKESIETFINSSPIKVFRCLEVKEIFFLGDIIISDKNTCLSDMLVDMDYAVRIPTATEEINTDQMVARSLSSTKLDSDPSESSAVEIDIPLTTCASSVSHERKKETTADTSDTIQLFGEQRKNCLIASKSNSLQNGSDSTSNCIQDCGAGYETSSLEQMNEGNGGEIPTHADEELNDNELYDNGTIANRNTDSEEVAGGYESDASRRNVFNFDNLSEDSKSVCSTAPNISTSKNSANQAKQLSHLEAVPLPKDSVPLKELSLIDTKTLCIGGEAAHFKQSKCYEHFLSWIADQLRELPNLYPLQKIAWPQLLEGRSAIIIDPSDNLADLLYLPVICTHVGQRKRDAKRNGPLAIIVCKNQDRCIGIAKRCLRFLSGGYTSFNPICYTKKNTSFVPHEKLKKCQIFVTTIRYFIRYDLNRLKKFNSVQKIVFDDMDAGNYELFHDIMQALKTVPEQIIVTSRFWRLVHWQIYNSQISDFLIFGAQLDIAIAANTQFDVLFAEREKMFLQTSTVYKLELILAKIETMRVGACLIILQEHQDLVNIKNKLKEFNIQWRVPRNVNRDYDSFFWGGKSVCFCISHMLPSFDLTIFSHYFICNYFSKAENSQEIQHLAKVFQSKIKPNIYQFTLPDPVTITFFCIAGDKFANRLIAESFFNYQRFMHCPKFWARMSFENILPFAHESCSNLQILNGNAGKQDELQLDAGISSIRFQIVHFYSPVHFKVEIYAHYDNTSGKWCYKVSQNKVVNIFLNDLAPRKNEHNQWGPDVFQLIFDRMYDPNECFECYEAMPIGTLKEMLIVKRMRLSLTQRYHKDEIHQSGTISFITAYHPVPPVYPM